MDKIKIIITLSIILSILVSIFQINISTASAGETVTVDLGTDLGAPAYKASGFLHAFDYDGPNPPSEVVDPLKIKFHRTSYGAILNQYERVKGIGAVQEIVVSDSWGYNPANVWPGDNDNWEPFETFVTNMVTDLKNRGMEVQYDIWNEPDISQFWSRSFDQYKEMWKRAFIKIREADPDAVIAGPSFTVGAPVGSTRFKEFLDFARDNNVFPDIITWHFPSNPVNEANILSDYLTQNNITSKKLEVNEFAWQNEEYSGIAAKYIGEFERSKVDTACHSIWLENWGKGDLDGLVFEQDGQWHRRGEWWVYKSYSDITGTLVKTVPTQRVDLLAGKDSEKKEARVLLGTSAATGLVKVHFDNISQASYLKNGEQVNVKIERIPGTNNPVTSMPVIFDQNITVVNDQLDVDFDWNNERDAYNIILSPVLTSTPVTFEPESTIVPTPTEVPGLFLNFGNGRFGKKINQYQYSNGTPMVINGENTRTWGFGSSAYNDNGPSDAYITYKFEGTKVRLYAETGRYCGIVALSILDANNNIEVPEADYDLFSQDTYTDTLVYTSPELSPGIHTLKARITGGKNILNTTQYWTVNLSKIEVFGVPTPSTQVPTYTPTAAPQVTFPDVDADSLSWAVNEIRTLASEGIIKGTIASDGSIIYDPYARVTRAQLTKLITESFQIDGNGTDADFDDVAINSWYYDYIGKAYKNGIINGTSKTTFEPDAPVTRQDMVTIIIRAMVKYKSTVLIDQQAADQRLTGFADRADIADYAKAYAATAVENGIIKGINYDGKLWFKPTDNTNRAEAAVVIYRMLYGS